MFYSEELYQEVFGMKNILELAIVCIGFTFVGLIILVGLLVRALFDALSLITGKDGFVYAGCILACKICLVTLDNRLWQDFWTIIGIRDKYDDAITLMKERLAEYREWFN